MPSQCYTFGREQQRLRWQSRLLGRSAFWCALLLHPGSFSTRASHQVVEAISALCRLLGEGEGRAEGAGLWVVCTLCARRPSTPCRRRRAPLCACHCRTPFPGGAPANVAAALAKLGLRVVFVSALGQDELGDQMLDLLSSAGFLLAPPSPPSPQLGHAPDRLRSPPPGLRRPGRGRGGRSARGAPHA